MQVVKLIVDGRFSVKHHPFVLSELIQKDTVQDFSSLPAHSTLNITHLLLTTIAVLHFLSRSCAIIVKAATGIFMTKYRLEVRASSVFFFLKMVIIITRMIAQNESEKIKRIEMSRDDKNPV